MFRVYCQQWLPFYTSLSTGEAGRDECEATFAERYEGRVEPEDWRIETTEKAYGRSFLQLLVPNCCGEYKDQAAAEHLAGRHEGHAHQVVERGSSEERELLAYGTRRLRTA
jgi:hypothetical protein